MDGEPHLSPASLPVRDRLIAQKQYFYLPFYEEVVEANPRGIDTRTLKNSVRRLIRDRHGFDPFAVPRAQQWASNLVSNRVLDQVAWVDRPAGGRTQGGALTVYPRRAGKASAPPPSISHDALASLNRRLPVKSATASAQVCLRSAGVAAEVRRLSHWRCLLEDATGCTAFTGRDGRPYVEVHHVAPMALQSVYPKINLDCVENTVCLCPVCHARVHHGTDAARRETVKQITDAYRHVRGRDLLETMGALGAPFSLRRVIDAC